MKVVFKSELTWRSEHGDAMRIVLMCRSDAQRLSLILMRSGSASYWCAAAQPRTDAQQLSLVLTRSSSASYRCAAAQPRTDAQQLSLVLMRSSSASYRCAAVQPRTDAQWLSLVLMGSGSASYWCATAKSRTDAQRSTVFRNPWGGGGGLQGGVGRGRGGEPPGSTFLYNTEGRPAEQLHCEGGLLLVQSSAERRSVSTGTSHGKHRRNNCSFNKANPEALCSALKQHCY